VRLDGAIGFRPSELGHRCCVVKVAPDGEVDVILKTQAPVADWGRSPSRRSLRVDANAPDNQAEWIPRMRKVGRDGSVTTLVTISTRDRAK